MKQKWSVAIVIFIAMGICLALIFLGVIAFQKPTMPLMVNGKTVAVVRQPLLKPNWHYGYAYVCVGDEVVFTLAENYFLDGGPVFIYPFVDGRRFFCDYDDDTSMLDFVVDLRDAATNGSRSFGWPPNDIGTGERIGLGDYVRTYMASRITNVVFETKGFVRLPDYSELAEVRSYLAATGSTQTKAAYFNLFSKEAVLLDLATNRNSVWPLLTNVTH